MYMYVAIVFSIVNQAHTFFFFTCSCCFCGCYLGWCCACDCNNCSDQEEKKVSCAIKAG